MAPRSTASSFADPKFSRGSFAVGGGPHSLRFRRLSGVGDNGGAAVYRLDAFKP